MLNFLRILDNDIFYGQFEGLVDPVELKRKFINYLENNKNSISLDNYGPASVFISSHLDYETKKICKARKLLWFVNKEGNSLENFKKYISDSRRKGYKFISTALTTGSYGKINMLPELGFNYVNTKLLFSKSIKEIGKAERNIYHLKDTNFGYVQLRKIMKNAFKYSRFYSDKNISNETAENLYMDWLKQLIVGKHDIYVSVKENKVAGFMVIDSNPSLKFSNMKYGLMYFVLVDNKFLNQQIGTNLLNFAEKQMSRLNIKFLLTNTQATNLAAVNFYIKNDFRIHNSINEYHWWSR